MAVCKPNCKWYVQRMCYSNKAKPLSTFDIIFKILLNPTGNYWHCTEINEGKTKACKYKEPIITDHLQ